MHIILNFKYGDLSIQLILIKNKTYFGKKLKYSK